MRTRIGAFRAPFGKERPGSSFWTTAEHLSVPTLQLVGAIPLVHGLGIAGFGVWIYLIGVATLIGGLTPGFAMAATQQLSGEENSAKKTASVAAIVGLSLASSIAVVSISAIAVYSIILNSPPKALETIRNDAGSYALAIGLTAIAIQADIVAAAVLRALLLFRTATSVEIVGRTTTLIIVATCALLGTDLLAILTVNATCIASKAAIKLLLSREIRRTSLSRIGDAARPAIRFALLQWPHSFNSVAYMFSDRIVLGLFLMPETVAVAALASQVAAQIHAIPRAYLAPLGPALIGLHKSNNGIEFEATTRMARRTRRLLAVAMGAAVITFGPGVIFMALKGQANIVQVIQILVAYAVGYSVMSMSTIPYLRLVGRTKVGTASALSFISATLNAAASLILGSFFGAVGVALAKSFYGIPFLLYDRHNRIS